MKGKKILCVLLIMSMLISQTGVLAGCSKKESAEEVTETMTVFAEGTIGPDQLTISHQGVSMVLNSVMLDSEVKATISKVDGAPLLDEESEIALDVYDFSLEGIEEFVGVIDLTIPLILAEGEIPGAAYFNESTGVWEPVVFRYDTDSSAVVISTDHLSKYGVFTVSGEGKRKARTEFLMLGGSAGSSDKFLTAVKEYTSLGVPASECVEIGVSAVGDGLQIGSDILGSMSQSAGFLAYGDDVLATVGDYLGNIGLMTSVVQIGVNVADGKIHEALVGSMKFAWSYTMGKVASKLSSSVMSASMAAVSIVDYSINKFGTEAIEGRASIYRDAYTIYYEKNQRGYKSSAYWYETLYPLFESGNYSEDELKEEIDKLVVENCEEFWGGDNQDGVDAYVDMARKKFAWTGGQAGLNDSIRDEISEERRTILYRDILPGVIHQIGRKLNLENERKLRAEYRAFSAYLNTPISLSVIDKQKTYAGHTIRFAPLNSKAKADDWTGKINADGTANTTFTLYGHMFVGAPNKLEILAPGSDVPVKTVAFKVTPPKVEIILDDEATTLPTSTEDESEEASSETTVTSGNQSYAWVLVETINENYQANLDSTNQGGIYEVSASAAPGSYVFNWKYIGDSDTYPDPDMLNGESYGTQLTISVPPNIIKGGETISLDFNLSFTAEALSYFDGHGSCRADWGNDRFANEAGKSFFEIYSSVKYKEKNISSVSGKLSAVIPNGHSVGDREELWTGGTNYGTYYVYEWKEAP